MFKCNVCGSETYQEEYVNEVFNIDGKFYLVENIPSQVCTRCGEKVFTKDTTEKIRFMLHDKPKPDKSISLDVFSYGMKT